MRDLYVRWQPWVAAGIWGLASFVGPALSSGQPLRPPADPAADAPAEADAPPADNGPYLGLVADDRLDRGRGIRVIEAIADGPAEKAGLMPGDLIVTINGRPAMSMQDLAGAVGAAKIGDTLALEIERGGQRLSILLELTARPPAGERRFPEFGQIPEELPAEPLTLPPAAPRRRLLGLRAAPLSDETRVFLRVPGSDGVIVTEVEPDSPAFAAGLTRDMVIVTVNGNPVTIPADLATLVNRAGPGGNVELGYYVNGQLQKRTLTLREAAEAPGPDAGGAPPAAAAGEDPAGLAARVRWLEDRLAALEAKLDEALRRLGER